MGEFLKVIMRDKGLIIISPKAPPNVCGVSDYVFQLSKTLLRYYETVNVGTEERRPLPSKVKGINVASWRKLISQKKYTPTDLIFNYTPLSYSIMGLPLELIIKLKIFKKMHIKNKLYVFFHETWSENNHLKLHHKVRGFFIKKSIFIISHLADGIAVATQEQKRQIELLVPTRKVRINKIGTNIIPLNKKEAFIYKRNLGVWVVFGLSHTRLWTLQANKIFVEKMIREGVLEKIISIGPNNDKNALEELNFANHYFGVNVLQQVGVLPPEEITKILLTAQCSLIGQKPDSLQKSGTFSAFAAHGLPVVCEVPLHTSNSLWQAILKPQELLTNPQLLNSKEVINRTKFLHDWFWSTRSWEIISEEIVEWMDEMN